MRTTLLLFVLANVGVVTAVGAYDLSSVFGLVPMNKAIFVAFLALVSLVNLVLILLTLRRWQERSIRERVLIIEWGWNGFWTWVFCPFYLLLVMNINTVQLQLALFMFVCLVQTLAVAYLSLSMQLFKPLHVYSLESTQDISKEKAATLYRRAVRFPLYSAILAGSLFTIGFGVATAQERLFASMPYIEGIKNYIIGFVAGIFLALVYYVMLRRVLEPLCSQLQEKSGIDAPAGSSIARRVVVTSSLVIVGSLLLLQLMVIKSFQNIIRAEIAAPLEQSVSALQWNESVRSKGTVYNNPQSADITALDVSPDTKRYIEEQESGMVDDYKDTIKLLAFFTDPITHDKSLIVIPIENYYQPILQETLSFLVGAFFVLLAGLAIAWLVIRSLTSSLVQLTSALHMLEKDPTTAIPLIASGDEVEDLSEALGYFVRRSQRINEEKSEFISIASHHLRTPLTELKWLVEIIEDGDPKKNISKYLPDLKSSLAHLSELVQLLLDSNRFSSNGVALASRPIDIQSAFSDLEKKFSGRAKSAGINTSFDAPAHLVINSDPLFFVIVLEAVFSNALIYTPAGGSIEMQAQKQSDGVQITCTDTGIGIPHLEQEKIFDKFNRASNARKMRPNGTGLGLYLARQSVLRMGGSIVFESKEGQGSVFTIYFPHDLPEGNAS